MSADQIIGRTISHYRVVEKIGAGGMGVVFRALDLNLERPVALKLLPPEKVSDPERKKRFVQEAKAASALNHPNIITIYEIGAAEGCDYIAMEFVAGKPLDRLIGHKPLPMDEFLTYAVQIAEGLAAAHGKGIIHRDLKPANIMISSNRTVKLLDFGLAKLTETPERHETPDETAITQGDPGQALSGQGMILGTLAYMSPEQIEGKRLDARSDVFSFGVVLYEMLTGKPPFKAASPLSTASAILSKDPFPPAEVNPEIPRELQRLVSRCLAKDPERRAQHMGDVKLDLEQFREDLASGKLLTAGPVTQSAQRSGLGPGWKLAAASALGILVASIGIWIWIRHFATPPSMKIMTRLTSDSGFSDYPALSADGKMLVYSSDRGGQSILSLWLKEVSGGEPIRLTHDEADAEEAVFSPDGSTIAFRSERNGGGIYMIPTLGGEPRLIAPEGRRPRFSPDGKWIAYWVGGQGGAGVGEKINLIGTAGGGAERWAAQFSTASHPVWSPDGKQILFLGKRDPAARWPDTADWWVAPLEGGNAANTGAIDVLGRPAFENFLAPELWSPDGKYIIFSYRQGDSTNLWEVPISMRTWKISGPAEQLTSGTGMEVRPSIAAGRLAFASLVENPDIWALPVDANGKVGTELKRLTDDVAADSMATVSNDGRRITFLSNRTGSYQVWVRELETGKEQMLTRGQSGKAFPLISGDGSKIAYADENQRDIYVVPTKGGVGEEVCANCGLPRSWTKDANNVLFQGGEPRHFTLLDLGSRTKRDILRHLRWGTTSGQFSPDGHWIAFVARISTEHTRIFIAPFRNAPGEPEVREDEWIPITDGQSEDDKPRWWFTGDMLYFLSLRDGFRCIWAQRLDPVTKRAQGPPSAIYHFHQTGRSMMYIPMNYRELSVARDKIVFGLNELAGNIWMQTGGREK